MLLRTVAVLAVVLHAHNVVAQNALEPLRGLDSLKVVVVGVDADAVRAGIDSSSVRVQAELELRRIGITVSDAAASSLVVQFAVLDLGNSHYAYSYGMQLFQTVKLAAHETARYWVAVTWEKSGVAVAGQSRMSESLQQSVGGMTREFLNDYLATNPPRR